jgi:hypothetical protein
MSAAGTEESLTNVSNWPPGSRSKAGVPGQHQRTFEAMMGMRKIDIAAIEAARLG